MAAERSLSEQRAALAETHLTPEAAARYKAQFPHVDMSRITEVQGRFAEVLREATVLDYLPILIEKEIKG